jgi:hypothetical protein
MITYILSHYQVKEYKRAVSAASWRVAGVAATKLLSANGISVRIHCIWMLYIG